MASAISLVQRVYKAFFPPAVAVSTGGSVPIRFGILGAANIAPYALIVPSKSHPEAVVYAVAARDHKRAEQFAKKHGIEKVHASYQDLLDDPQVDAVYNPLPNGLHYEWTMKALLAGKHVLLEKPASNTAEEAHAMYELAETKNLVILEAFHYRFHPAIQRLKAIILSGELGRVKSISTSLVLPNIISATDIRYNYSLGGGALMDMGCYTLNCMRYLASPSQNTAINPTSVLEASAIAAADSRVDRKTTATLAFPNDIIGTLNCDFKAPLRQATQIFAKVECEGGRAVLTNFVLPTLWHSLTVVKTGGASRTEKVYVPLPAEHGVKGKGEEWWLTYRYQLEAFVDRIRGRDTGKDVPWITKEDTYGNMEWIEKIYEKTALGSRPKSEYVVPAL